MQVRVEDRSAIYGARQESQHKPALTKPVKAAGQSNDNKDNQHNNVGSTERVLSSLIGGALLLSALRSPTPGSAARLLGGTALLHRGATGHCYMYAALGRNTATTSSERSAVQRSITIGKSADELYQAWRDPQHIAAIMGDFASVDDLGNGRFHWTVRLPRGRKLSWTTITSEQRPGELVAWRTEPGSPFTHEGSVRFRKAPGDIGPEVTLCMTFGSERGALDKGIRALTGTLLRAIPRTLEESILRRSKSLCETGEMPTLKHNASHRAARSERAAKPHSFASQSDARSLS